MAVKTVQKRELSKNEIDKFSGVFVNTDEKYVASLGNGYIANYLTGRGIKNGFAILSNRRVYFKGSCLSKKGKNFTKANEERTVDAKDITGSGYIYQSMYEIIICAVMFFLLAAGFWFYMANNFSSDIFRGRTLFALIWAEVLFCGMGVVYLVLYALKKRTLFSIEYAGGCIAFDVTFYSREELDDFQKQLRLIKDETEQAKYTKAEENVQISPQKDIAEELRKYSELLKDGLITQEEYENMKRKILEI